MHYYQVSAGSPALSIPTPPENVSTWEARDRAVRLPWRALRMVLHAIIADGGETERYLDRLWAKGTRFVSYARDT